MSDLPSIKHCPFCGAGPDHSHGGPEVDHGTHRTRRRLIGAVIGVKCYQCGGEGPAVEVNHPAYPHQPLFRKYREIWDAAVRDAQVAAIEKWNARPSEKKTS